MLDELQTMSQMMSQTEYSSLVMGVIQVIMLAGMWMLKLRKRMQSNEAKVEIFERKLSRLQRGSIAEV